MFWHENEESPTYHQSSLLGLSYTGRMGETCRCGDSGICGLGARSRCIGSGGRS
ncbi:hypothetical protein XBI1_280006 [Xenorhabdus bovienii str. Intermedium]|uniref:Uncharacterized protein n=1 Tax=Xenorhabdus bovienii str. Intermedium TaxID=1379677 RepID=A0A077QKL6_XENBV|nr:hypothetical protein XBI1_280006 [Xenorhabdus bovienii str. Intermedium]